MIAEIKAIEIIQSGILGNYRRNYKIEFDLEIDFILIVYMICTDIFLRLM